ncbi:hypothetical protein RRG08_022367 [Elysia crispata]|uniref:Secreted protein n=1 Tax=Elysia crispata TaxID=231223 RepID=A0AAE0Z1N8_9GAST|nr:hypothetical protein RRG08_022367 [Elysia crispata]
MFVLLLGMADSLPGCCPTEHWWLGKRQLFFSLLHPAMVSKRCASLNFLRFVFESTRANVLQWRGEHGGELLKCFHQCRAVLGPCYSRSTTMSSASMSTRPQQRGRGETGAEPPSMPGLVITAVDRLSSTRSTVRYLGESPP